MPPDEVSQGRRNEAVEKVLRSFREWLGRQIEKNKKDGLTQAGWADAVGTRQPNLGRWHRGEMIPGIDTVAKLSLATGDPISVILGEQEPTLTGMALVAAVHQASPELQRIIWEGLDPKFGPVRNEELAAAIERTAPSPPSPPAPESGAPASPRKRHRKA